VEVLYFIFQKDFVHELGEKFKRLQISELICWEKNTIKYAKIDTKGCDKCLNLELNFSRCNTVHKFLKSS